LEKQRGLNRKGKPPPIWQRGASFHRQSQLEGRNTPLGGKMKEIGPKGGGGGSTKRKQRTPRLIKSAHRRAVKIARKGTMEWSKNHIIPAGKAEHNKKDQTEKKESNYCQKGQPTIGWVHEHRYKKAGQKKVGKTGD